MFARFRSSTSYMIWCPGLFEPHILTGLHVLPLVCIIFCCINLPFIRVFPYLAIGLTRICIPLLFMNEQAAAADVCLSASMLIAEGLDAIC